MSIVTNVLPSSVGNMSSVFSLLPSCEGCLVIHGINIVRDVKMFSKFFKLDLTGLEDNEEQIITSIYLMGGQGQQTHTDQSQQSFQTEELFVHTFIC